MKPDGQGKKLQGKMAQRKRGWKVRLKSIRDNTNC
jgi:hypothetical protein